MYLHIYLLYHMFCNIFIFRELPLVVFSGGMPYGNKHKGLTVMKGRSKSLLLSEQVIDFQCLLGSPWPTGQFLLIFLNVFRFSEFISLVIVTVADVIKAFTIIS